MKLDKIKDIVLKCLKNDVNARNSDWILFNDVCTELKIDVSKITVEEMCRKHNDLGFPCFESVRRSRQKIQSEGLYKPDETVKKFRNEQEKAYRKEFA